MLHISGQTAEPIGLKFFVDTHRWPRGVIDYKKYDFFSTGNARRALQLVHSYDHLICFVSRCRAFKG